MSGITLLSKTDSFSREAQRLCAERFGDRLVIAEGSAGDPRPAALSGSGEYLISFLSPWIVPAGELSRFGTSINFHPGTADYPGTGCYNFALWEGAREYGAVCHQMLPKVDTGGIFAETRFPIPKQESVEGLKLKTMVSMLGLFTEVVDQLAEGEVLPPAIRQWSRRPFTRAQLDMLKVIDAGLTPKERARRIRATVYPGHPGPVIRNADGTIDTVPVPRRSAWA